MPNWCDNTLTLIGAEQKIADAKSSFLDAESKFSFDFLIPRPEDIGDRWYEWSVENWGTKWDLGGDYREATYVVDNKTYWSLSFHTAWGPCVPVVEFLADRFNGIIHYYYDEMGMDFSGLMVWRAGNLIEASDFDCSIMTASQRIDVGTYMADYYYDNNEV